MYKIISIVLTLFLAYSCKENQEKIALIPESNFSTIIEGKPVMLYTLKNKNGLVTQITNLGGRVVSLWTPDTNGKFQDIVLGFDNPNAYLKASEKYFGTLVGRYGNCIAKGKFTLNGQEYILATNNG